MLYQTCPHLVPISFWRSYIADSRTISILYDGFFFVKFLLSVVLPSLDRRWQVTPNSYGGLNESRCMGLKNILAHLIDLTVYECTNVLTVDKIAIFKYIWIFWQFESIFYCQRKKLKTDNKQDVRLWDKMNDCTISLNKLNEFCLLCVRKFCSREILHFLLKVIAWFFRIWILKIEIWKSAQIFNM